MLAVSSAAAVSYQGCYSSAGSLQLQGDSIFLSKSSCVNKCPPSTSVVATSDGDSCYCGDSVPPEADLVDDSQCNMSCTGYPEEMCGGAHTFSVYLTGESNVDNGSSSSEGSPSSSTSPTVVTVGGQTTIVTTNPTMSPSPTMNPSPIPLGNQTTSRIAKTTGSHRISASQTTGITSTPSVQPNIGSNQTPILSGLFISLAAAAAGAFL